MNDLLRRMLFLPEQGSAYAQQVDALHYFVVTMTMLGFAGVATAVIWFVIRYRRRSEGEATPRVEPRAIHEVLFVGGPLALFLLWFAIGFRQYVELSNPPSGAMDVFVQGKKWMWKFAYQGGPSSLDVLRVPAGRPVRLLITSRDVIATPTTPTAAFRLGEKTGDPLQMYLADIFTVPANLAGLPALSLPCGLAHDLPVGLQLLGRSFDEETLLRAGAA